MISLSRGPDLSVWYVIRSMIAELGPDYMSRAGPVSRVGVNLPGSRHVC